ncbi:MAG: acyl carrier protein [Candidatus Sedimenticola sp. (ex Thyasira tokunagai)]
MTIDLGKSIKEVVAKQKLLDVEAVSLDSSLRDLGISSLDAITIVYEIEELFDIEVPNEQLEGLQTVQDIVDGIGSLIKENS